jgi:hypothetical protein
MNDHTGRCSIWRGQGPLRRCRRAIEIVAASPPGAYPCSQSRSGMTGNVRLDPAPYPPDLHTSHTWHQTTNSVHIGGYSRDFCWAPTTLCSHSRYYSSGL